MYRIVKPGGIVITMTPDWESVYKIFYIDYTHRTPFSKNSLEDIFIIHGFNNVEVEKFKQLPLLWKFPFLKPFYILVSIIAPRRLGKYSPHIRFSKEGMLLSSAIKPI